MKSNLVAGTLLTTTELVRTTLKDMYPDAKQITLVEHGYDNIVGLVDETYAVRFPRNADAYKRSQYEKAVLKSIEQPQDLGVPKVLGEDSNPPCLITSFLRGKHLSSEELNNLSPDLQEQFAKDIAAFAYKLHSSLLVETVKGFRKEFGIDDLDEDWGINFEKYVHKATLSTNKQNELARYWFDEWQKYETYKNIIAVHDDLHSDNLLFKDSILVGVLDFGDTNVGTPEQELRQLYRINGTILRIAVNTYSQLSGTELSFEAVRAWAIVQELSSYSDRLSSRSLNHPSFIGACSNLNNWLPEGEWGKQAS
jgi:aminoglycoside phosphotransferase (APT) family kinase protein